MIEEKEKWYIIKCPSGVENKFINEFKETLTKLKAEDLFLEYFIPDVMDQKNTGSRKILMANYIFVKLIYKDVIDTAIHRLTYASFLRDASFNLAQADEETIKNLRNQDIEEREKKDSKLQIGEAIIIMEAPFMEFEGKIEKVNEEQQTASVSVNILGNPIFIELPFTSIKRINNE